MLPPSVRFGRLLAGSNATRSVEIRNDEDIPLPFRIEAPGQGQAASASSSSSGSSSGSSGVRAVLRAGPGGGIAVSPCRGTIPGHGSIMVEVQFHPSAPGLSNCTLRCMVGRRVTPLHLNVKGEAFAIRERLLLRGTGIEDPDGEVLPAEVGAAQAALGVGPGQEAARRLTESATGGHVADVVQLGAVEGGDEGMREMHLVNEGAQSLHYEARLATIGPRGEVVLFDASPGGARDMVDTIMTRAIAKGGAGRASVSRLSGLSGAAIGRILAGALAAVAVEPDRGAVGAGETASLKVRFTPPAASHGSQSHSQS